MKTYPFDPERAKALLAEAGWKDTNSDGILAEGRESPSASPSAPTRGTRCASRRRRSSSGDCGPSGIDVKIHIVEWAAFINTFIRKKDFEAIILGWGLGLDPDQYEIWHSSMTGPDELNHISYKNPKVDALLEAGRRTFDQAKRKAIYGEFQDIMAEEQPVVFLYVPGRAARGLRPGARHRAGPGRDQLQLHQVVRAREPATLHALRIPVLAYLIRRLLISIPLLLGILCLSFLMLKLAPGEPTIIQQDLQARATGAQRETLRQLYGLDKPIYVQFGRWLWRVVRLDFGRSYSPDGRRVLDKIAERIPITLGLNILETDHRLRRRRALGNPLGHPPVLRASTRR